MSRLRIKIDDSLPWNPIFISEAMEELFPKVEFLSFEEAKEFVIKLNISDYRMWRTYIDSGKKPKNIPACPQGTYKNKGWNGWGDFLGTGAYSWKKGTSFLSFEETRNFMKELGIKQFRDWIAWCRKGEKPINIPFTPKDVYKDEWKGWGHFLGTGRSYTRSNK